MGRQTSIRRGGTVAWTLACAFLSLLASACGMHERATAATPAPSSEAGNWVGSTMPAPDAMERFISTVRKLSMETRPDRPAAATIEGSDARLASALAAAVAQPSPERLRDVAAEYARMGVNDRAFDYVVKSMAHEPRSAAGFDALARLWRDSGFPEHGLGDAYRAVYHAPSSPVTHNTLGTLLQAVGAREASRREYDRAVHLDPSAAYALTNLCYSWLMDGHDQEAEAACLRALQVNPNYAPARNNLAIAYGIGGNLEAARNAFDRADDSASAFYNIGLLYLARHEYQDALDAFTRATELRPVLGAASIRVRQARQELDNEDEP